jgi:isoquinoline 1-oxidoreductase beta subunit
MNAITHFSRRRFIINSAALGGGMALTVSLPAIAAPIMGTPWGGPPSGTTDFSAWVAIAPDDKVTVRVPTPEIGNGVMTQCAMTVTEELACRWSDVTAEFAPTDRNYAENNVYVGRSGAMGYFAGRSTGADRMTALLQAGASARERLKAAAAARWKVPVSQVTAKNGVLSLSGSRRTLRYGEVAAEASKIVLKSEPAIKPESEWTFLGKATPGKLNNPAIVDGSATYGIDVRLPNMLYAAIKQSPVHGGTLKSYDFEAIRNMPGVHSVVVVDPSEPRAKPSFESPFPTSLAEPVSAVAVLADHYYQAATALGKLPIEWDDGKGAEWKSTAQMETAAQTACRGEGKAVLTKGTARAQVAASKRTVEAEYITPYCDQAALEPLNGAAFVTADHVEVWVPSQQTQMVYSIAAEETGLRPEQIRVHQTYVGGGFGRRVMGNDARMVLAIAKKAPGRPVKVIWSREEVMRQGRYRALEAIKLSAALGDDGLPTALVAHCSGGGHSTAGLADTAYVNGPIPHVSVESTDLPFHIMTGPYRGPGYNSNGFFLESFIDECAAVAKIDPLEYRKRLLASWPDEAWTKCLDEVARQSGWGEALPKGQGRGVAITNWAMDSKPKAGTTVATVARVEVSQKGVLKIHQIDVAVDCGKTVNRDAVLAQMQGGTIFGLNMSMNEQLTVENGRIVEGNFNAYPMLHLADIPPIRVHFGGLSGGDRFSEVGESPIGPIGPALANAIFAATGRRLRRMPFSKQDLSWT